MTIQETLQYLQTQVNSLLDDLKYAKLQPKFHIDQNVWVKRYYEYTHSDPNGFYIQAVTQTLESSVEKLQVTSIEMYKDAKHGITYRYHLNRFYQAPNNLYEDEMFLTREEAMEALREKFEQSLAGFRQRSADEENRKRNEARKILGLPPELS